MPKHKSTIMVTVDDVRTAIERRFPDLGNKISDDEVQQLANRASEFIASGFEDGLDLIVMEWANKKVSESGHA